MRLSELKPGEEGVIVKILGHGAFRKRMIEMGFVRGHKIKMLMTAPMLDPVKYSLLGYEVSLRRSEAELVEVIRMDDDVDPDLANPAHTRTLEDEAPSAGKALNPHRTINIALIGNPNCGKTSLFNIASGSREHVGNYSGVTVDAKMGHFSYGGYDFRIVDLPGTYSLASYSPEELYVRRYLRREVARRDSQRGGGLQS